MPKIIKDTIKLIPKIHTLKIYKKENRKDYYCSFYVGTALMKSGNKELTLKTENVKDALKKARETYSNWFNQNKDKIARGDIKKDIDKDIATPYFKPGKNKTSRNPNYYIHETDSWLVFPHELDGLTVEELVNNKPELGDLASKITHIIEEKDSI